MNLDMINRYDLAVELLALDARINIVTEQTGFSAKIHFKLAFKMHHRSPSKGSLKISQNFFTRVFKLHKEATLYAFFFRTVSGNDLSGRSINAYRRYSSYIKTLANADLLLDFSDVFMISEWLESGYLKLVSCSHCRSAKLINNKLQHTAKFAVLNGAFENGKNHNPRRT
jgi:flagellar transcriptional activator FlhC